MTLSVAADHFSALNEDRSTDQESMLPSRSSAELRAKATNPQRENTGTTGPQSKVLDWPSTPKRVSKRQGKKIRPQGKELSSPSQRALETPQSELNTTLAERENSMAADLNETRARTYDALDLNRNYRQINILLTYRRIKLREESRLLVKQSLEFYDSIWASYQQIVTESFALLSRGKKEDPNEP